MPADLYRILDLSVNGAPLAPVDELVVQEIVRGTRSLRADGVYYTDFDSAGAEKIGLYPVPTAAGLSIAARIVYRPATITDTTASPIPPEEFHLAPVHYAASVAYGFDEDNTDLHSYHQLAFENFVEGLRQLRFSRQARGPALMQIQGVHF